MNSTILLVEDENLIALNETRTIHKHGYEVRRASTGEEAVEIVENDPQITLVLMDIDLGEGIDGTEAAERILEIQEVPIVFLTGHSEKEYVDRVKEISDYGYVLKNSGEFVLIESIKNAFTLFDTKMQLKNEIEDHKDTEEELDTIYQHTPLLMVLLDEDRRVKRANTYVSEYTETAAEELVEKRVGEVLRCLHHLDDPQGCGYGPSCENCTIRQTVKETFRRQRGFREIEAHFPLLDDGGETTLIFLFSTAYVLLRSGPRAVVSFEDVTRQRSTEKELEECRKTG